MAGICDAFYGEPSKGVYSPSVQYTLFEMGKAVLARCAPGLAQRSLAFCRRPSWCTCHTAHAGRWMGLCDCLCCLVGHFLRWQANAMLLVSSSACNIMRLVCLQLLALMADGDRVSAIDSIFFNLPNIHFIPCPVVTSKVCGRSKCLPS